MIEATGTCTITWTSNANFGQPFFPPDANVAFTAWILGEEDFTDIDGNNIFNNGDFFDPNPNDVPPLTAAHGDDLIGPYLDLDHDGVYTLNVDDVLVPGNSNGVITQPDQLYNGQNCTHPTLCSQTTLIYISHHVVLPIQEDATAAPALSVTIDVPANNTTVANGNNVTFTATATDPEDGTILGTNNPLPGNDIVWSSDQDGLLSNNNITSVTVNDLSINTHVITVTVTDSNGNTATDTITIVIN
ncbi:MAG TPA: hypothetical protein ENJ08_05585 [Gammaproteobacteria bacterium]|nr:hypothetical protein [Gammaproteobacteria bacterium]